MKQSITFLLCNLITLHSYAQMELIQPDMVDVTTINPTILVGLFLADPNNFLHQQLYPDTAKAYLHRSVAEKLDEIQKELAPLGLGLKIKDAYRPLSVQKKLWKIAKRMPLQNPQFYVSDPNLEGGRHPRGIAVDVTLVHLENGQELPMPPMGFTEKAHHLYTGDLTAEQIENRELLKNIMIKYGLAPIRCEWWHYNVPNWWDYQALDLTFEQLNEKA